jgi:hypothetical protein
MDLFTNSSFIEQANNKNMSSPHQSKWKEEEENVQHTKSQQIKKKSIVYKEQTLNKKYIYITKTNTDDTMERTQHRSPPRITASTTA